MVTSLCKYWLYFVCLVVAGSVYSYRDPTMPPWASEKVSSNMEVKGIIHSKNRNIIMSDDGIYEKDTFMMVGPNHVITNEGQQINLYPNIKTPVKESDAPTF